MTSVSGDSTTSDNAQAALLRRRAIHVAGHAVIALAWDFKVLYLTIGDPHRTAPPHFAADWVDARVLVARPESLYGRSRQAELFVRIILAGSVSQQLYADDDACSSNWRVCGHDYELAWSTAAHLCNDAQDRRNYLLTTLQRLRVMMQFRQYHDEVLELASALEERGELYQSDIRAILSTLQHDGLG